jgi:hypothetical protein
MILGYKVGNFITALYFQSEMSYCVWEEEKPTNLWYWSVVFSLQLLLILAAEKGLYILSFEEYKNIERASRNYCLPGTSAAQWVGKGYQGPPYQLVLCSPRRSMKLTKQADRLTWMPCPYSWKRGKYPGYIIV